MVTQSPSLLRNLIPSIEALRHIQAGQNTTRLFDFNASRSLVSSRTRLRQLQREHNRLAANLQTLEASTAILHPVGAVPAVTNQLRGATLRSRLSYTSSALVAEAATVKECTQRVHRLEQASLRVGYRGHGRTYSPPFPCISC
jgi:hypothetical protein